MTTLRCRRFPRGTAHIRTAGGVVVDFHDGRAEVDDPELVAALLAVPAVFGVEADGPVEEEVPGGTIADILAWVGVDAGRAARALAVEEETTRRPRLIGKLKAIVDG